MSHTPEHGKEPVPGLPEHLPPGERILWQGSPDWRRLAICALHARKVASYLALLLVVHAAFDVGNGASFGQSLAALSGFAMLSVVAVGLLALTGWLFARATLYTITNRRLVMRFGVALSISFNLPFAKIEAVELRRRGNGCGDIAVPTAAGAPLSWVVMWPHAKPWSLSRVVPMLRCVPDADGVARTLADALCEEAAVAAPRIVRLAGPEPQRAPGSGDQAPLPPLIAAAGLAVFALLSVALIRVTGGGPVPVPVDPKQIVAQVDLRFEDRDGGYVAVIDASNEQTIEMLAPGEDSFMRATMRGLAKARRSQGAGDDEPFSMVQTADGRLLLVDEVTGRQIDLWAFGETNGRAFARLLNAGAAAPRVSQLGAGGLPVPAPSQ